jgi:hypothetical protein
MAVVGPGQRYPWEGIAGDFSGRAAAAVRAAMAARDVGNAWAAGVCMGCGPNPMGPSGVARGVQEA